jgi:hypothetical protein
MSSRLKTSIPSFFVFDFVSTDATANTVTHRLADLGQTEKTKIKK